MTEVRPTVCRFCSAHCGVLAMIEDGKVVQITGDRDNPLYRGYACPKGRALPQQHAHPERLLHSLKRTADGHHEPIEASRALDEIAIEVQSLVEHFGPRSVAMYVGTNSLPYVAAAGMGNAWLRAIGSPMFFTANTIDQPGKQVAMALHGGWHAGEHEFSTADVWMLTGLNPIISKSSGVPNCNPAQQLKDAVARGMKLIVIDPRRTETAKFAAIHLQPRPGEDPTILAGLLHIIIQEQLYDRNFVTQFVEGFDALSEHVASFTPEYVSQRAGVPVAQLLEAARVFAMSRRGCSVCGTGPNFATKGNLVETLSLSLNTLCGRWKRAGEKAIRPNVLLPAYTPKAQPYAPYPAQAGGEKLRVRNLADSTSGLPTAALADEILLEGPGQVKALICIGSSPMAAWPDQRKTFRALQELELLVTIDPVLSATAKHAHYVIAPKLTLETPGSSFGYEMLKYFGLALGYAEPYAQYTPALVDPPAGSDLIEEWEFFYELARRMNLPLTYAALNGWGHHQESRPLIAPIDMANKPTTEALLEILLQQARIPLAEVKKYPHGHIFEEANQVVQPADPDCTAKLQVGDPYILAELTALRAEDYRATQDTQTFPFRLIPRRANNFLNSSGQHIKKLYHDTRYNPAYMHSEDIQDLDLTSGRVVRIESKYDAILGVVREDDSLRRGTISMTHGFGEGPNDDKRVLEIGSSTSRLMSVEDDYDSITGMPRMGAIPVRVEIYDL